MNKDEVAGLVAAWNIGGNAHTMALTWQTDVHGILEVEDQGELDVWIYQRELILRAHFGEGPLEVPQDRDFLKRMLEQARFALVIPDHPGPFQVTALQTHLPFEGLKADTFGNVALDLLINARMVRNDLFTMLGIEAADSINPRVRRKIADLWERWEREGGFQRWLDSQDAFTAGERLYFELHTKDHGDREAAAKWWRQRYGGWEFVTFWHKKEFIRALVDHCAGVSEAEAA